MTSTPASRSARATTFAPRSWPSSPAFATITRILPMAASLVHAGNAVLRDHRAALRAGRGQGGGRGAGGGRRGGTGDFGVPAQVHLHVPGGHRGARRRGDAEKRPNLGAAR